MNLNRLAYFAAVVDAGSFTGAAKNLGITKAVVSQQVAKLEDELETTLLVRTTRRVQPTEAGRAFYAHCAVVLRESESAFDELAEAAATPTGTLRITAPFDYGTSVVVPVMTEFLRRHPECEAALTLSDKTLDLVSGSIDLAIHVGWLNDSNLRARRIGIFHQWLVCALSFADAVSRITEPGDLSALPFVANTALRDPLEWHFTGLGNERRTVRMRSTIAIDATPAVQAAVLGGAGMSVLPDYLAHADVTAGRLLHVLPDWKLRSGGIHIVFPPTRFRPTKVSAFLDLLAQAEDARKDRTAARGSVSRSRGARQSPRSR